MKKYMHTISGRPAIFQDGQIVFAGKSIKTTDMADSLKQIRREQEKSTQYRFLCFNEKDHWDYGYVLVKVG